MRTLFLAVSALLCAIAARAEVVVLTDATFESSISNGQHWFVKTYAPWCGHCKRLAPTWEELGEVVASGPLGTDKHVNIASINCQEYGSICSAKGVRGYPTLLLFKAGEAEPIKYQGARDVSSFVTFLEQRV